MKRHLICLAMCLALFALAISPSVAQAGLATDMLWKDGQTINNLEDSDYEGLTDNNSNGNVVDVGDYLWGMWEVSKVQNMTTLTNRTPGATGSDFFTAVFAMEVLKVNGVDTDFDSNDDHWVFGLGAISWDGSTPATDPFKTITGHDRLTTNTFAIMFSDSDGIPTPSNGFSEVGGTKLWEWGFTTTPPYDDTKDDLGLSTPLSRFWIAETDDQDFDTVTNLHYQASLDITHTFAAASSLTLLTHNHGGTLGWVSDAGLLTFPSTGAEGPIHLRGEEDQPASPGSPLLTNTDIYLKPIPEPSTWVALVGLALMGLVWRWRRSK